MQAEEQRRLEEEIQHLCQQGELGRAAERVLQGYGTEIRRVMSSMLRDEERTKEAFSAFSESLLKGLPRFRWESTCYTWLYRMARNACLQQVRAVPSREQLASPSMLPELSARQRSATSPWQQTTLKARFRALREHLEPQDRLLLELRLDQQLPWLEVARRMSELSEAPEGEALSRRATALRQQFQRVKSRLRALALEQGLLGNEDSHTRP